MERDAEVIDVLNELVSRKPRVGASGSFTIGCGSMADASITSDCIACTASSG